MAKKAVARIEIEDTEIKIFSHILIQQHLFGHHVFQLQLPLEVIEGYGSNVFSKSKELVGKPLKISLESEQFLDGSTQTFSGIVTTTSIKRMHGGGSHLVVIGKSPTILLDDGLYSRSFSEKTLADIVGKVTGVYPSNVLSTTIDPIFTTTIPYIVQYRETNFHFLARLADLFGEWMYFNSLELVFGQSEAADPIPLHLGRDLFAFDLGMSVSPVNFEYHTYQYATSELLESKAAQQTDINLDPLYGEMAFGEAEKLFAEAPLHPIPFLIENKKELDDLVQRKRNQLSSNLVQMNGQSDNPQIGLGHLVEITGSKDEDFSIGAENYGQFIVTQITHRISGDGDYKNNFNAIPKEVGIPPTNPHIKRVFSEPQPGVVIDNKDPKKLGRVQVSLYWQKEEEKTPWIRLLNAHGNGTGGWYAIPEIGDEVMVGYEHNYPDRPFVMGSLYHSKAKPAENWYNDDNNIKAFKTKSGNEIQYNDEGGNEEIKILNKGGTNSITLTMGSGGSINISSSNVLNLSATTININAAEDLNITSKKLNISTEENTTISSGQQLNSTSGAETTIDAGANMTLNTGADLAATASGAFAAQSGADASVSGGTNLKLEGAVNAELNGTQVAVSGQAKTDVSSSGPVIISGLLVQLN